MKNLSSGTHCGGFQFLLILDLCGISFHAVIVLGLGKNLLFKSTLGRCDMIHKFLTPFEIISIIYSDENNSIQYLCISVLLIIAKSFSTLKRYAYNLFSEFFLFTFNFNAWIDNVRINLFYRGSAVVSLVWMFERE